ncbi:MAG TPA: DUF2961 domain-containing protein [Chloroflexota bacterium]|nr:DUF2961 domain-containing protein [Chloroflexota bacterium]
MSGVEGLAGWFDLPRAHRPGRAALVTSLEPGETATIADVQEPGCFRHLVCTPTPPRLRELVLEAWWDDAPAPSVECPLPDFFGSGHGGTNAFAGDLRSLLLRIAPRYGYNSYFPMPFARRGLLRLRNDGRERNSVHVQADFHRYAAPVETPLRFNAAWRRACPAYRRAAPLTLLETTGSGYLAGLVYHVRKLDNDDRWTHAGGDHIFIDGLDGPDGPDGRAGPPHYLHGDGGEDFYGGGWGLYPNAGLFAGAHHAHPLPGIKDTRHSWEQHEDGRYSMYRWYVDFPVAFARSLRVAFGTLANEISATAYWYQAAPHPPLPPLPAPEARAYGAPLAPDAGERPLAPEQEWPLAVLGPFPAGAALPWNPEQAPDLGATYETAIGEPFQDVTGPPWPVRWQATRTRHRFVDFEAIHRAKRYLTPLGLSDRHVLPPGTGTFVLVTLRSAAAAGVRLEVGFEDELVLWLNRRRVGAASRPRPLDWGTVSLPLRLRAGENELVLWQTTERRENWTAWAASLRLRGPDGRPPAGVEVGAERLAGLPETLERWREPGPDRSRGSWADATRAPAPGFL